jgi:hypothetical protein
MTIYRSSGKNTEVYEEYELYTKEYVENVGGKSNFTAKGGTTIGENPKTEKPLEITNLYVKVRLAGEYKGEFGFDWVDVNPDTKEIEKIQDVPFSDVEYFYKKDPNGLGNIVEKSTDEMGAKHAVQDHYKFSPISKYVDIPYVLLMPTKKAVLSAEIILWQGAINEDVVSITGDEFYEFDIIGGEKEGKTAKKKVTAAGKIEFQVECLQPGAIDKTYEFKHSNPITGTHAVGGVRMMENKVLKLKFRVIALVSSDGSPSAKAKALFQKFNDKGIADYLNKNSLNQAGYEVEIENQTMFDHLDTADVDDYLYAFDKEDWKRKELFKEQYNKPYWDKIKNQDGTYTNELEPDGKHYKTVLTDNPPKPIDVVTEGQVDYKTIEAYKTKLKSKSKTYNDGILILSDYASPSQTAAFSRTSPLDHYALFVYSSGIETKENYAHEIGHMLGLPHSFYTEKEKEAYKNARESILGNGTPEYLGLEMNILKTTKSSHPYGAHKGLTAIGDDILHYLEIFKRKRESDIEKEKADKQKITTTYVNYKDSDKINSTQTKGQYLKICDQNIAKAREQIDLNKVAKDEIKKAKTDSYITVKNEMIFFREDYILLLKENLDYSKNVINQMHCNYLLFKQGTTKNILDYHNKRLYYSHNQIFIMRSDIQNYMDIPCKFCANTKPKKK